MAGRRITVDLPAFTGVAVSQTATLNVPIGRTIHYIMLNATNLTLAEITGIRVVANGQIIQKYRTGTELNTMNLFHTLPTAGSGDFSSPLYIPFDRPNMRRRNAEELTALGTGVPNDPNPITTLQVEVDIAAGATGVTLSAQAIESAPTVSGLIRLIRPFNYAPAASGDFEISDFPRSGLINSVYAEPSANNVDEVEIKRDNFTIFKRTNAVNNSIQTMSGYRANQSGTFVVDFSEQGFGSEAIKTQGVQDLRFVYNVDGAMTLKTSVDYIAPLGR